MEVLMEVWGWTMSGIDENRYQYAQKWLTRGVEAFDFLDLEELDLAAGIVSA